jgi:hypothetical protein
MLYGLCGLCVGSVDQFDRFPCVLNNDVNKPKRLGEAVRLLIRLIPPFNRITNNSYYILGAM